MAGPYASLQFLLGAPNMSGIIKTTADGILDIWEKEYYTVDKKVHGNTGQYTQFSGVRQNATISNWGAPSKNRQLRELGIKPVTLVSSCENIILQPQDYMNLIAYDDLARQEMGVQEVRRQVEACAMYLKNLRISLVTAMMFQGQFYWDDKGNVLSPAQAGQYGNGVNYGIPAGNTGQLNPFGVGNIINTSWATTSANIIQNLTDIKKAGAQLTGYQIERAYYGSNIGAYLANNTTVQAYLSRAQFTPGAEGTRFVDDGELHNFFGITWVPAYKSSFQDNSSTLGVTQTFVGPDQVIFTPKPSSSWVGMLEGSIPIPKRANIVSAAEPGLITDMEEAFGMYAHGVQMFDPASVKIVYGTNEIPVLKVPSAVFQALVVPGATS